MFFTVTLIPFSNFCVPYHLVGRRKSFICEELYSDGKHFNEEIPGCSSVLFSGGTEENPSFVKSSILGGSISMKKSQAVLMSYCLGGQKKIPHLIRALF